MRDPHIDGGGLLQVHKGASAVVLASVWHDDNKGDSAIAEAVLMLLLDVRPGADVTLAAMLDTEHPGYATAFRHLLHAHTEATVIPSPLPKIERSRALGDTVGAMVRTVTRLMALALPGRAPLAEAIRRSTLVVANGGHTLYAQRGPGAWFRLLRILYPYWLARRLGRPYALFGQSLGPFDGRLGRAWVGGVLRGAERVLVREELSRDVALELGVPPERVAVVPDPAFALTPSVTDRVRAVQSRVGLEPGHYWVVTVRQAYSASGRAEATARFIDEMARFVALALQRRLVPRIVIVAHTLGPVASEDDRLPARALHARVRASGAVLVEDDLSPRELAALYGDAAWVVGTRFHSVILALVGGTPTLAVSYFGPKTHGIMQMLDLDDLCLDLATFDAERAIERIEAADPRAIAMHTRSTIEAFRVRLRDAAADVWNGVDRS